MYYTKKQAYEILNGLGTVRDSKVFQVKSAVLAENHTRDENEIKVLADKLTDLGQGVVQDVVLSAAEQGLEIKKPSFRVYVSVDGVSDLPYVKLTIATNPSSKFVFKETLDTRSDANFETAVVSFLNNALYSYIATAIAYQNVTHLNEVLQEVKNSEEDGLEVAFDLSFALSEKPIHEITDEKLVLGTTVENMLEVVSPNSKLLNLFVYNEDTEFIGHGIKSSIKDDWAFSANGLAFLRAHNTYLMPLVVGNLNTRRTQRADVLLRNSFKTNVSSLEYRKNAVAHKIEQDGEDSYISLVEKVTNKDKESTMTEILSPINTKTLTFKA